MGRVALIFFCVFFVAVHIISLGKVTEEAKKLPAGEEGSYVIPGPVMRITAVEFDGIVSDLLFLKSLVFLGSTNERKEEPKVKASEWNWLYHILDAASSLDPYFLDPYYFGNANLTWGGGFVKEANLLLEKGIRHRTWDSLLPFYLGFNYFYFLDENEKASEWLMEASRRPGGADTFYANLAVKLSYKERRLENAIAFQEYIVEQTEDPSLRREQETVLNALQSLFFLQNAEAEYKRRFGRYPKDIFDLVASRVIKQIPSEPYGGYYYIDILGHVKSSNEVRLTPYRHQKPSSSTTQPQLGHVN